MKRLLDWKVAAVSLCLMFAAVSAPADTIILKDGRKVEGKVLQKRPEFIEMDRGGSSVLYTADEIKTIEWSDVNSPLKDNYSSAAGDPRGILGAIKTDGGGVDPRIAQEEETVGQEMVKSWKEWLESVNKDMESIDEIEEQGKRDLNQMTKAMENNDIAAVDKLMAEQPGKLSSILSRLEKLKPAEELTDYHKHIIAMWEYHKRATDALLRRDRDAWLNYTRMATAAEINSKKELRRLFVEHAMPREALDDIDKRISQYKQQFKAMK